VCAYDLYIQNKKHIISLTGNLHIYIYIYIYIYIDTQRRVFVLRRGEEENKHTLLGDTYMQATSTSTVSVRDATLASGGLFVGVFATEYGQQFLLHMEKVAETCLQTLRQVTAQICPDDRGSLQRGLASVADWDAPTRHQEAQGALNKYRDLDALYRSVLMDYANQITRATPVANFYGRDLSGGHHHRGRIHLRIPPFTEFLFAYMKTLACGELVQNFVYFDSTYFIERKIAHMDAARQAMAQCLQGRIQFTGEPSTTASTKPTTSSQIAMDERRASSVVTLSSNSGGGGPVGSIHATPHHHQQQHRPGAGTTPASRAAWNHRHESDDDNDEDDDIQPSDSVSQAASRYHRPVFHAQRPSEMAPTGSAFAQALNRQMTAPIAAAAPPIKRPMPPASSRDTATTPASANLSSSSKRRIPDTVSEPANTSNSNSNNTKHGGTKSTQQGGANNSKMPPAKVATPTPPSVQQQQQQHPSMPSTGGRGVGQIPAAQQHYDDDMYPEDDGGGEFYEEEDEEYDGSYAYPPPAATTNNSGVPTPQSAVQRSAVAPRTPPINNSAVGKNALPAPNVPLSTVTNNKSAASSLPSTATPVPPAAVPELKPQNTTPTTNHDNDEDDDENAVRVIRISKSSNSTRRNGGAATEQSEDVGDHNENDGAHE